MICNDYGDRIGCLREADERYTMHFDDIGEPPIFWCSFCGSGAHEMLAAINKAFETRADFGQVFQEAIAAAESGNVKQ